MSCTTNDTVLASRAGESAGLTDLGYPAIRPSVASTAAAAAAFIPVV